MSNIIGKVTATEHSPTSCNVVRFWVEDGVVIRPFDIVRIQHLLSSYTYAIVTDLTYITDSPGHLANYVSSDFGDISVDPLNKRIGTTIAEAEILYNTAEIEMPVRDGAPVEWADVDGIRHALGLRNDLKHPIPAGYMRMSNNTEVPVEVYADYVLGPEGAHLNISGISGLATKTSYAMFLLSSVQQRLGSEVTIIIFNVKGKDLLAVDRPNENLTDEQRSEWIKCGLEPKPFDNVTYLYPYAEKPRANYTSSHVEPAILNEQIERGVAFNYFYDVNTAISRFGHLFSDIDDPNSTMESIIHYLQETEWESWGDLREKVEQHARANSQGNNRDKEITVNSWRKFKRLLRSRTEHDVFRERACTDVGKRRQTTILEAIRKVEKGSVLVIDIEPLPDYLQCMVVGDVVNTVYGAKLGDIEDVEPSRLGTVVIFADELNKYAPKEGSVRPLTKTLLDVTERGRSLGLILFGVEQFRSGVHDRILGNCSTNVYGRTNPIEISKCPDYRFFHDTHKSTLTRLPKGNLLLQHAVFKTQLINVRFPVPCYYQPKVR